MNCLEVLIIVNENWQNGPMANAVAAVPNIVELLQVMILNIHILFEVYDEKRKKKQSTSLD